MTRHPLKTTRRLALMGGVVLLASLAAGAPVRAQPAVATVAHGLVNPWAVAFLPDGRFLVTERPGRMRIVAADGNLGARCPACPRWWPRARAGCWTW